MSKVYLLAGISGVGKSSVVSRALEILEEIKSQSELQRSINAVLGKGRLSSEEVSRLRRLVVERANFGEILFSIAKKKRLVDEKAELGDLPDAKIQSLQRAAVTRIKKMKGTVLVDLHLTVRTSRGIVAGLPISSAKALSPEVIILLQAPAEEVFRRRMKDRKTQDTRQPLTLEGLKEHMAYDQAAAICIATVAGIRVTTIKNSVIDDAAYEVVRALTQ